MSIVPLHFRSAAFHAALQCHGSAGGLRVLLNLARQVELAAPWAQKRPSVHAAN